MPSCLPLRFSDKPLPGRNRLTLHTQLLSVCVHVSVYELMSIIPTDFFIVIEQHKHTTPCWNLLNPHSMQNQQLPCKPLKHMHGKCTIGYFSIRRVILQTVLVFFSGSFRRSSHREHCIHLCVHCR